MTEQIDSIRFPLPTSQRPFIIIISDFKISQTTRFVYVFLYAIYMSCNKKNICHFDFDFVPKYYKKKTTIRCQTTPQCVHYINIIFAVLRFDGKNKEGI